MWVLCGGVVFVFGVVLFVFMFFVGFVLFVVGGEIFFNVFKSEYLCVGYL